MGVTAVSTRPMLGSICRKRGYSGKLMPNGPILIVNRVGFVGGAEKVLLSAGMIFRANGHDVVLACPAPSPLATQALQGGLLVVEADIGRTNATLSPRLLLDHAQRLKRGRQQVQQLVASLRPDMIHVHHPVAALYVTKAARQADVPVLLHIHETLPVSRSYELLARYIYRRCDHLIGVSDKSCEMAIRFGIPARRVTRIYNAVDDRFFADVAPAPELQSGGPHIGIFGAIEVRKGQEYFIRAAAELATRYPGAQFWIVGAVNYADAAGYQTRLETLASELGIRDRVHFTGFRSDIPALMMGMDAIAFASTGFEALPTVIIEACALGKPVVATTVGGVAEILRDGETGWLLPPRDPAAMASALNTALGDEGTRLGANAKQDIRRRFNTARFEAELMACVRSVRHAHDQQMVCQVQ
jgi:glycosyltransferase involved in cell wall biosynthesis